MTFDHPYAALPYVLRIALSLWWIVAFSPARSQPPQYANEELEQRFAEVTTDTARLHTIAVLGWRWLFSPRILPYLDRGDSIAARLMRHPDSLIVRDARLQRSWLAYMRGYYNKFRRDLPAALHHFREARRIAMEANEMGLVSNACDGLGVCYLALDMPQRALIEFDKELDVLLSNRLNIHENIHRARLHRVAALVRCQRIEEARRELARSTTTLPGTSAFLHMQWADLHAHLGDTVTTLVRMDSALALIPSIPNAWDAIPVLEPTARMHLQHGSPTTAFALAQQCTEVAVRVADEGAWCGCTVIAGEALLAMGQPERAEVFLRAALDRARSNGYIGLAREIGDDGSMVRAAEELKELYKASGREREALRMTEYWALLKDSVHLIEARDELLRADLQQAALNDSLADQEHVVRVTQQLRTELENERGSRKLAIGVGIGAGVIGGLILFFFIDRRKRDRTLSTHQLQRQEDELMIRDLRMREQMSQDLHEELGAGLSALKLWSEMDLVEESDQRRRKLLEKRVAMADELITSLRQIIWALTSRSITLEQLVNYLAEFARLHATQHGLSINMEMASEWPHIELRPEQRRLPLLALKECLQHAWADPSLELTITWADGLLMTLRGSSADAKRSMDPADVSGMRNMQHRLTLIRGELIVNEANGTTFTIRIPFHRP